MLKIELSLYEYYMLYYIMDVDSVESVICVVGIKVNEWVWEMLEKSL